MTDALTFPQHGDEPDAAFFAKLIGVIGSGIVADGLAFSNVDLGALTFDVDGGTAYIVRSTMQTASSDVNPAKTVDDAVMAVQFPGDQGLALTDNAVNHIWLDANVANDDQATIVVNTDGSEPADASIKIGEIDTNQGAVADAVSEQWYLTANDGTLTFPDEAAADAAATNLRSGTVVYNRATGNHYRVN